MNKIYISFFIFCLCLYSAQSQAQEISTTASDAAPKPAPKTDRNADLMTKQLGLSVEQHDKIAAINEKYQTRQRELRKTPRDPKSNEMRMAILQLKKEQEDEIKTLVGEEKWTNWVNYRNEEREKARERRQIEMNKMQDKSKIAPPAPPKSAPATDPAQSNEGH